MRLDMMYFVERLIVNDGEGAGGEGADEQRADQAGCISDGDSVDIIPSTIGIRQSLFNDRVDNPGGCGRQSPG